jgi:hypothetical protein
VVNGERRIKERHDCTGDYFFSADRADKRHSCVLKNISVTGACIETVHAIETDDIITVHICNNRGVELDGKVVWKKSNSYGLLFLLETPEAFDNISYLINNRPV